MPPRKPAAKKLAPTMGNSMRHLAAEYIQSRLPDIEVVWKSGHGSFQTGGKVFSFITREGQLAMKLSSERIAGLIESGEYKPLGLGKRTMQEWLVVPIEEESAAEAFKLLKEAKAYVESLPKTPARKRIASSKKS